MKRPIKNYFAIFLALCLALTLCACGETDTAPFHVIAALGVRRYHLICRRDDRLAPLLDAAMETLAADGTLSAASVRWLGRDAITLTGGAAPTESAEGEAEELPPRTLIVGVEQDFDPMAYWEDGTLRGMSVDIADALGRILGWEVAYQPITAGEVGTQLSSGNIDVALGFDPSVVWESRYSVGAGYMESEIVLAARRESGTERWRDLQEQKIGAVDDPVITALLAADEQARRYAAEVTVYSSAARCVFALDNGWCAAVAMDRIMLERQT